MRIASGVTDQYINFVAVDSTDFTTRETGLTTFTVYRSRNNGTATAMTTPTVAELDATNMPGVYTLLLDEDMTIGAGNDNEAMVFHITQASMAPVTLEIELYRSKITAGYTLGVGSDGDLLEVNTLTGHTVQTGDSYARIGAPAGASISADIAEVLVDTGTTLPATLGTPAVSVSADIAAISTAASPSLLQTTTIATLASQTSFTLTAGSADDSAYVDSIAVITDAATAEQKAVGTVSAYTGSTKTVTLSADPAIFTMAVGDAISIIAGTSGITASQVNAEVVDVLNVDTYSEPGQGNFPAAPTIREMTHYVYKSLRNKKTATNTTLGIYDDAGSTLDHKATISDDGTTYTEGEFVSGA